MMNMAEKNNSARPVHSQTVRMDTTLYELIETLSEKLGDEDEGLVTMLIFQLIEGGQLRFSRWCNN